MRPHRIPGPGGQPRVGQVVCELVDRDPPPRQPGDAAALDRDRVGAAAQPRERRSGRFQRQPRRDRGRALLRPTSQPPWPVPLPFWAALVDAPTDPAALGAPTVAATPPAAAEVCRASTRFSRRPTVLTSRRHRARHRSRSTSPSPTSPPRGETVDGRIGMLAASAARRRNPGRSHPLPPPTRTGGALVDPTGAIVAAAQNADLLYLQHIVIPPGPLQPPRPHPTVSPPKPPDRGDPDGA